MHSSTGLPPIASLYEYCRRRYDSELDPAGVWVAGDIIDEAEWTDPATLPRPTSIHPQQLPERPKVINLATDAIVPLADKKEVVQIRISEEQMMKRVRACGATPTSFLTLLLARAIARLHPESAPLAPTVTVAVDLSHCGTPFTSRRTVPATGARYAAGGL